MQMAYMRDAIPYLESEPQVAKYAWFADAGAIKNVALTTDSGLTELGQLYTSAARERRLPALSEQAGDHVAVGAGVVTDTALTHELLLPTPSALATLSLCRCAGRSGAR